MINKIHKVFYRTPLYALLILILTVQCAFSQTNTYTSGDYTYQSVENDPFKARIYKLANGLTVYMTVYKDEPRIQTLIAVRAGSKYDPSDATGLAHYLEHMLFKGTDKYGTINYAKEKVYLDKVIDLYEVYRKTTNKDKRKKIYHQLLFGISKHSYSNIIQERLMSHN